MSWSFSSKSKSAEDALRDFSNQAHDNDVHMPNGLKDRVIDAAKSLVREQPKDTEVMVSTSGHVDPVNGIGYGVVRFEFVKAEYVPPHLEGRK